MVHVVRVDSRVAFIEWSQNRFGTQHTLGFDATRHDSDHEGSWVQTAHHPSARRRITCPGFLRERQAWRRVVSHRQLESCTLSYRNRHLKLSDGKRLYRLKRRRWRLSLVFESACFAMQSVTFEFRNQTEFGASLRKTIRMLAQAESMPIFDRPQCRVMIPSYFALLALSRSLDRLIRDRRLPGTWTSQSILTSDIGLNTTDFGHEGDQHRLNQQWIPDLPICMAYRHHRIDQTHAEATVIWVDQESKIFVVQDNKNPSDLWGWRAPHLYRHFHNMSSGAIHLQLLGGLEVYFPDMFINDRCIKT